MKHINHEKMEICGIITQGPQVTGFARSVSYLAGPPFLHNQMPSSLYLPTGKVYPVTRRHKEERVAVQKFKPILAQQRPQCTILVLVFYAAQIQKPTVLKQYSCIMS